MRGWKGVRATRPLPARTVERRVHKSGGQLAALDRAGLALAWIDGAGTLRRWTPAFADHFPGLDLETGPGLAAILPDIAPSHLERIWRAVTEGKPRTVHLTAPAPGDQALSLEIGPVAGNAPQASRMPPTSVEKPHMAPSINATVFTEPALEASGSRWSHSTAASPLCGIVTLKPLSSPDRTSSNAARTPGASTLRAS